MKEKTTPPPAAKRNLTPEQHIICQAKSLGVVGKHAGSKPISRLKKSIARVNDDYQKQRFAAKMAAKQKAKKAKKTKKYKPQKKV